MSLVNQVGIRKLAALVGCSPSTVSLVLNDRTARVNDTTRERILEMAQQLGYPSEQKSWRPLNSHTEILKLTVPAFASTDSAMIYELTAAITEAACEFGYQILLQVQNDRPHHFLTTRAKRIDGEIFIRTAGSEPFRTSPPAPSVPPYVVINLDRHALPHSPQHLTFDLTGNMQLGVSHLQQLGHAKITYLTHSPGSSLAKTFLETHSGDSRTAVIQTPPTPSLIIPHDFDLLTSCQHPTAIVVDDIRLGISALRHLRHSGINIPEQVSIFSIEDHPMAEFHLPGVCAVTLPVHSMAKAATAHLIASLEGVLNVNPHPVANAGHIISRDSCGKCLI